ncbi:hypothetical protein BV25DRAFT_1823528 [Artomyces pyxidatus]|uniref:Uncharacterized protein n=1 Tax=Artomyces pyxidatus TaxID=48021 RepID=A0ACB8T6C6_9AGAM|nr:hypothetical protein BV25DRAFT_1823528 [Artomyces pyxidatus]
MSSAATVSGPSSTDRALVLPEILARVFGALDAQSNVSNAVVCKTWSEAALDELWRDVRRLERLVRLLIPPPNLLTSDETPEQDVVSLVPSPAQWARFNTYARRVRTLGGDEDDDPFSTDPFVRWDALETIAIHRPSLAVLPNLQCLRWFHGRRLAPIFFSPTVTTFHFDLAPSIGYSDIVLGQTIVSRMPGITRLRCFRDETVEPSEDLIRILIDGLPQLQDLSLPTQFFTADTFLRLSKLPNLRILSFDVWQKFRDLEPGEEPPAQTPAWTGCFDKFDASELAESAFPALQDLSLYLDVPHAIEFFNHRHFPAAQLRNLYYQSDAIVSPSLCTLYLDALKSRFSELRMLVLKLSGSRMLTAADIETEQDLKTPYTLDSIRPIVAWQSLTTFTLSTVHPLALTDADALELALGLPALEDLDLNCAPLQHAAPPLTFAALFHFAAHCRRLHTLALYLDPNAQLDPSDEGQDTAFAALRTLILGPAPIEERSVEHAALYISRAVTRETQLCMGSSAREHLLEWNVVKPQLGTWNQVALSAKWMLVARKDEARRLGR